MNIRTSCCFVLPTIALALSCGGQLSEEAVEVDEITAALEAPNGGIDDSDEAPMFGDASFAIVGEVDEDPADDSVIDEVDEAPDAPPTRPDSAKVAVTILWGKLRPDLRETDVTDWSGALATEGAAIIGARTIRFEGGDRFLPRRNRGVLGWISHTRPHHDGIAVLLRVPLASTTQAGPVLHLRTAAFSLSVPLAALLHDQRIIDVGDNKVAFNAFVIRPDDCNSGRMRGYWTPANARNGGRFFGRWMSAGGKLHGHVRGIYGVRANGEKVFFGKIIDRQGRFIGRMGGKYGDGHFGGLYRLRNGDVGGLRGRYVNIDKRPGGLFAARWAEMCRPNATTMPTGDLQEVE